MAPKVERLVNLVVALLETRRPLTFQELRRRTRLYPQADHEAARRMFERDKDDLRRLGVPVETRATDPFDAELGYLIDRRAYEAPDIDLTADEMAALAVALRSTGDPTGALGLAKLAARAPDPAGHARAPAPAVVGFDAGPLGDLADPLLHRRVVRFDYRTADGRRGRRAVDPYAVVLRRGAWYLVGRDHDRDDQRAFRLDRVRSRISAEGPADAFPPPRDLDIEAAVGGPATGGVDAEIAVAPALRWSAEQQGGVETARRLGDRRVFRFVDADPVRLASWACGLGPDAVALSPPDFRDEVVARLERLAETHA